MNMAQALAELGLSAGADESAIRDRYRQLVKRYPPDRDPQRFQRIRQALELATNPRARAREAVLGPAPYDGVDDLLDDLRRLPRQPLGPSGWLEVIKP